MIQNHVAIDNRANLKYEEVVGDIEYFFRAEYELLQPMYDALRSLGCRRLVDAGCGIGAQAVAAARCEYEVIALDHSMAAVIAARYHAERLGLHLRVVAGDIRRLPFALQANFDVVQCLGNVLLLCPSRGAARLLLDGLRGLLRPGGFLVVGYRPYSLSSRWRTRPESVGNRTGFQSPLLSREGLTESGADSSRTRYTARRPELCCQSYI